MNPLVAQQFRLLAKGIESLRQELIETREQLESVTAARDDLQRKSWAQAKELSVFKQQLDEVAELRRENERYREMLKECEERMRRVLQYTEALGTELRG